jgi:flagellar basal-body rod protein FlgG
MRALYTAASGMTSQQLNVDVIANNLANVNTTAFKKENLEFQTMLYQTLQSANIDENGAGKPVGIQVGLGVKPVAISSNFSQGSMQTTDNALDFAIEGNGFFTVQGNNETQMFTRNGAIKISATEDGLMFVTSSGEPFLDINDEPIVITSEYDISRINVNKDGSFSYTDTDGTSGNMDIQFKIVQFDNPQGLEKMSGTLYQTTSASGQPRLETDDEALKTSTVRQRSIEMSNVQVVEEMVKLISAQRAYDLSSKAITTSDQMLQQANSLKN